MNTLFSRVIGIDLGTSNTLIYERSKGIILDEPSVIAMRTTSREIIDVGEVAHNMFGRTPGDINALYPIKAGRIDDFDATEAMIRYFIKKSVHTGFSMFNNVKAFVCITGGLSDIEKRAVEEAVKRAGVRDVFLVEQTVATAVGAGLDISNPQGAMMIEVGGGTCDIAVISMGGVVVRGCLPVGGISFDRAIAEYIKKEHNTFVGEATAEYLKLKLTDLYAKTDKKLSIRGRGITSGLPVSIDVTSSDIKHALRDSLIRIVRFVIEILDSTPPELASDIFHGKIYLSGGSSLMPGLSALIANNTGVRVESVEDPAYSVIRGVGMIAEEPEIIKMMMEQNSAVS